MWVKRRYADMPFYYYVESKDTHNTHSTFARLTQKENKTVFFSRSDQLSILLDISYHTFLKLYSIFDAV